MKSKYSTHWRSSSQPRKQRKFLANAPLHIKHSFLSSNLSKTLRKQHGKRSIPIRNGDEVLIMRGSFKKKKAKVTSVNHKRTRITLEGMQRTKKDGTKVNVFFHPSSVQIQALNLEDKERIASINKNKPKQEEKNVSDKKPSNN